MMFGMGLTLTVADFTRLLQQPKGVLVGTCAQLLGVPLMAMLVINISNISAELAVGILILAACPGGPGSNTLAFICRGNAALSVTLTAISSCLAIVSIPLVTNLGLDWYLQTSQSISVVKTVLLIMGVTMLPLILGMGLARAWPHLAKRAEPGIRVGSILGLLVLVAVIFYRSRAQLPQLIDQVGLSVVLLCICTIGLGFAVSKVLALDNRDQKTIAIEVGIQNSALAIVVADRILQSTTMTIPAAMYSPVMITAAALFVLHYAVSRYRLQPA